MNSKILISLHLSVSPQSHSSPIHFMSIALYTTPYTFPSQKRLINLGSPIQCRRSNLPFCGTIVGLTPLHLYVDQMVLIESMCVELRVLRNPQGKKVIQNICSWPERTHGTREPKPGALEDK